MTKTAIVTGSAGNMGKAVVKKFLAEGYKVIGTIAHEDTMVKGIDEQNFEKVIVDLRNEEATERFVNEVAKKNKTIDVAVFTAGGYAVGKIADTTSADILQQYRLNFETAYNMARPLFLQMMQEGFGRIFLAGSRSGLNAGEGRGMLAYSLSKSLLFRLAELLNDEANGANVVVSVLVPGIIDTPQNRKSMPEADFRTWVDPVAIADVIYFYCSKEGAALREPVIRF